MGFKSRRSPNTDGRLAMDGRDCLLFTRKAADSDKFRR